MKKLSILLILIFAFISIFAQVDTAAIHNAANVIAPRISIKYWPIAAKIFGIVTALWVIVSEILPFLPTKANGVIQGIFQGIVKTAKPLNPTGTTV